MTEKKQMLFVLEGLVIAAIFAFLYTIGGSEDFGGLKFLRRFVAPVIFCTWGIIRSKNYSYLVALPFIIGALTLPYGAETIAAKIGLRAAFGAANGLATAIPNLLLGRFTLTGISIFIMILISVIFGVINPFNNAIAEQFLIGFMIVLIPTLSLKRED